jgi:copper chaperone CopZ
MSSHHRAFLQCSVLIGLVVAARQRGLVLNHGSVTTTERSTNAGKPEKSVFAHTQAPSSQRPNVSEANVELAVRMHCDSCVKFVKGVLFALPGVKDVQVDLVSETVIVTGSVPADKLADALVAAGKDARVVGLGHNENFVPSNIGSADEWGAAVGEFKGAIYNHGNVLGVVRIIQVAPNHCNVEAQLSGLDPDLAHSFRVHEYGDLRKIPQSTGNQLKNGLLGSANSSSNGELRLQVTVPLKVWELIGRSILLYRNETALYGTVIARSANIGANTGKRLCTCDGTVIW